MAIKPITTYGKKVGNSLTYEKRDKFKDALLNLPDCDFELTVSVIEHNRSNAANRYYWGKVNKIAMETINEEWGTTYGKLKTHEILKEQCNQVEHETSSGGVMMITRDTHDMPHSEFCDFVERCRRLLAELFGVYIPDPDKNWRNSPDPIKIEATKTELSV